MTSLVPFFILLLTAYTFAAPVGQETSTIEYGLTTEQTTVDTDLISNNLSTAVPIIQKQRAVGDSSSIEVTTESVARTARNYDQKYKPTYNKVPKKSFATRGVDSISDSKESESSEKRDSKEALIPTSSKDYKKRADSASQESLIQTTPAYKKRADAAYQDSQESISSEKRESVLPTTTGAYKKRSKTASQESLESASSEKRESKEALIPTTTAAYKKRAVSDSQESLESTSSEKRESVLPTTTGAYKKRSKTASQESLESNSSEKRESVYSTTPDSKKRAVSDSQESLERSSTEKRANRNLILPTTPGYKKSTSKSYLFTTLESSTAFNRRAMRPVESQEEPESGNDEPEQKMKMSSGVKPSSSSGSFGKPTRPLNNEQVDQSSEEFQSQMPIKTKKITKTISVFPGNVRQNEVDSNVPSKSSSMMQRPQQEQLSQGQSQSEY